jgi:hypothetical protein
MRAFATTFQFLHALSRRSLIADGKLRATRSDHNLKLQALTN